MRLELWLTQLIATASTGLLRLQEADSDADYRQAAESVADAMGPYVCDTLVATCELDRPPAPPPYNLADDVGSPRRRIG